jgi:GH25 family lysozyme M1 (1,4-beta-N-acetylmuramidase)
MTKQTAVEWLIEQISNSKYFYKLMEDINLRSTVAQSNIFEQAKEMEKERMIEFSEQVFRNRYNEVYQSLTKVATDTYNETFKQQ